MGQLSRTDVEASDWTELEQTFFAAAPPEIALQPPPAASFDDLEPIVPDRPRRRAAPPARSRVFARAVGAWVGARARGLAALMLRLAPRLAPARARLERDLRALLARVTSELPERPDGKTLAAAIAALVVVFGVSARVLGSRRDATAPVAVPAAQAAPAPLADAEPAAPALAPEPVGERAPATRAPQRPASSRHSQRSVLHASATQHHPKHHAAPRSRRH